MNENVKIYICTHTDFNCPVRNRIYEIADSRKIFTDDKAANGLDGLFYSELMTYKHLADHSDTLPEIVGFCGYRKYFFFLDNVPNIADLVERHGCITTTPYKLRRNVYKHYGGCFCFADMDVMKAVIRCKFPWLYPSFDKMLNSDWLYTCNMFIMRKDDFVEMMNVVWDAIDTWIDIIGMDIKGRIERHSNIYLAKSKGGTLEHQYRIGGNLGERIVSAYISHKFHNPKTYDIIFTEYARPRKKL